MATPRKKSAAKSRSTKPAARSASAAKPAKKAAPPRASLNAKSASRPAVAGRTAPAKAAPKPASKPAAKQAPPKLPLKAAAKPVTQAALKPALKTALKPAAKPAALKGKPVAAPVSKGPPVINASTRVKLAPPGTISNRSKSAPKTAPRKGAPRGPEQVRPIGMLPPQSVARPTTHRPPQKAMTPKTVTPKTPRPHDSSPEGALRVTENDMKEFEDRLLTERRRILKEMGHLETTVLKVNQRDSSGDLSGYSFHMADAGTDAMEREKAFLFASVEGRVLLEIDDALRRLYRGEYGVCESCHNPIARARLEVMPHARLCIACKEKEEKEQRGAM
jgi:RNA polymerase-binding transcription factor DksA